MAEEEKVDTKELELASDGRSKEAFDDLEARRNELSKLYGKKMFSRASLGSHMGIPGPTIQRIERVTAKTSAYELEQLETALNELERVAIEEAAEAADDESAE